MTMITPPTSEKWLLCSLDVSIVILLLSDSAVFCFFSSKVRRHLRVRRKVLHHPRSPNQRSTKRNRNPPPQRRRSARSYDACFKLNDILRYMLFIYAILSFCVACDLGDCCVAGYIFKSHLMNAGSSSPSDILLWICQKPTPNNIQIN